MLKKIEHLDFMLVASLSPLYVWICAVLYTLPISQRLLVTVSTKVQWASAMIQLGICCGSSIDREMVADRIGPTPCLRSCTWFQQYLHLQCDSCQKLGYAIYGLTMGSIMGSIYALCSMVARIVGLKAQCCILYAGMFLLIRLASPVIGVGLVTGSSEITSPTQYLHYTIFAGVSFLLRSASVLLARLRHC